MKKKCWVLRISPLPHTEQDQGRKTKMFHYKLIIIYEISRFIQREMVEVRINIVI